MAALFAVTAASSSAAPKKSAKRAAADAGVALADAGPPEPFAWDIPDIVEVVDVQGELTSAGIPVRASAVRTKATGEALVMHVFESFRRAGLFVPLPGTMTQIDTMPQLTGFDTERHIGYTAMFQANPDGTTTVILTEADIGHRKAPPENGPPLMPDARGVVRSTLEGAEVVTYSSGSPSAVVERFYAGFALDAGLASEENVEGEGLRFEGQSGSLSVNLEGTDAGTRVTVIDRRLGPGGSGDDQNVQGELK